MKTDIKTEIVPYFLEIIEKDANYEVECVGYFIKDGIVVIECADGGRELIKEFERVSIPKEWKL